MGSEKSLAESAAGFASARDADRRIAGVAAAARAVKALAEAGGGAVRLRIADGSPLAAGTLADVERLRGPATVAIERGEAPAPRLPSAWEIVRATGKPGDGLVSRWLNRPISKRITMVMLAIPGARPIHVTLFNAALALIMFAVTLGGGEGGLIIGGILFQTASLLDGVDGEMARATWRSSKSGATLDSAVDIATNLLFVTALTIHLALRDHDVIFWVGAWAVTLSIVGGLLIARQVRAGGAPLGFDLLKRSGRIGGVVDLVYWAIQTLTGRDCFAFLYMALIIAGLERTALWIYAGVGTIWLPYVIVSVLLPRPGAGFRNAA